MLWSDSFENLSDYSGGPRIFHGGVDQFWGRGPSMRALFSKNLCENERIVSHRRDMRRKILCVDPPLDKVAVTILEIGKYRPLQF